MATTSTVPTVKAALTTLMATAIPTGQVSYGYPGDVIERDAVWISTVDGTSVIPTMRAGRKTRHEEYRIRVHIDVAGPADTITEVEERAFDRMGSVEDILADDPSLGGIVTAAMLDSFESDTFQDVEGSACRLTLYVRVQARLA